MTIHKVIGVAIAVFTVLVILALYYDGGGVLPLHRTDPTQRQVPILDSERGTGRYDSSIETADVEQVLKLPSAIPAVAQPKNYDMEFNNVYFCATIGVAWTDMAVKLIEYWTSVNKINPARMFFTINQRDDSPESNNAYDTMYQLLLSLGVLPEHTLRWTGTVSEQEKMYYTAVNLLNSNVRHSNQWVVNADADELTYYGGNTIVQWIERMERENIQGLSAPFVDKVAADGSMPKINISRSMAEQYPLFCMLTRDVLRGGAHKLILFRADFRSSPHVMISQSHFVSYVSSYPKLKMEDVVKAAEGVPAVAGNTHYACECRVYHYKWTSHALSWQQHRASLPHLCPEESQRIVDAVNGNGGKIPLGTCSASESGIRPC